jgi:hypothetical protein
MLRSRASIEDLAVMGWIGEAVAHRFVYWAATAGALFVLAAGYAILKSRRPSAEVTDV